MVANLDVNNLKWEWEQQRNRDRYVWKKTKTRQQMYTRFQSSRFQTFELRFPNSDVHFLTHSVLVFQIVIARFSISRFPFTFFFNCWVGLSKFRFTYDWHFQITCPMCVFFLLTFSTCRFQHYSFLVFEFPISNIRLQIGSFQLQIVILEFAFSFCSDVRCQLLQNGWLLRMGSTHLATGMVLG